MGAKLSKKQVETQGELRLVISSIGTATPRTLGVVANGLSISTHQLADAVYRAPAIIAKDLSQDLADGLADLLAKLGYEVKILGPEDNFSRPKERLDISVYVEDASNVTAVAEQLTKFLGVPHDQVMSLLCAPLGVVIGAVTQPTVDALSERLKGLADVRGSDADAARYTLFLEGIPDEHKRRQAILKDLEPFGVTELGIGVLAENLERKEALKIWTRHAGSGALRVINEDFLRFDMNLQSAPEHLTPTQYAEIVQITAIPEQHVKAVLAHAPVTLLEALPRDEMSRIEDKLTQLGLSIEADMISFLHMGIQINSAPNQEKLSKLLSELGLEFDQKALPKTPFILPYAMPDLKARIMEYLCLSKGVKVELIDARLLENA